MIKENKANMIAALLLTGFFMSICFHYVQGAYLVKPYPYNTFLFIPADKFMDFFNLVEFNKNLNPYFQDITSPQYPLLNYFSYLFSKGEPWMMFIIYNVIVIVPYVYFVFRSLDGPDKIVVYIRSFVLVFMSYPFLFSVDRGNFETMLCVFLMFFIFFYKSKNYLASALFLSMAISMKMFPVVLLLIYISDEKYKTALSTVSLTAIISLVCLSLFDGGMLKNLYALVSGANLSNNPNVYTFTGDNNMVQRGVTLFTLCKVLFVQAGFIGGIKMAIFLKLYQIAMICIFAFVAIYIVFIERVLWRRMAVLVAVMLIFPHISADYKMIHIMIPLLMFVNYEKGGRFDLIYVVIFALLMIPKDYFYFDKVLSDSGAYDISISVLMNPLLLLIMMLCIFIEGFIEADLAGIRYRVVSYYKNIRGFV